MADETQQVIDALKGPPVSIQGPPEALAPPRWGDYARGMFNTGGSTNPASNLANGPITSEGAIETIMGMDPLIQALRGAKDLTDKFGITKPMRGYDSKIGILPENKV